MKSQGYGFICGLLCVSWYYVAQASIKSEPAEWDYFVYTQQWPQGACIEANNSGHICGIPENTTTWAVHGLWPDKTNTTGPNYCNKTDKFEVKEVEQLVGQLMKYWPNFYSRSTFASFWKHEWEKHGTCAKSVPAVSGELNYFSMGLQLNRKYDLLSLLNAQGVVPDENKLYNVSVIVAAVRAALNTHALVRCTYDEATKSHHLMEVEMCLDKGLAQMDCPNPEGRRRGLGGAELCPETKLVHYLPIKHTQADVKPLYDVDETAEGNEVTGAEERKVVDEVREVVEEVREVVEEAKKGVDEEKEVLEFVGVKREEMEVGDRRIDMLKYEKVVEDVNAVNGDIDVFEEVRVEVLGG